jgi:hypothetical protein
LLKRELSKLFGDEKLNGALLNEFDINVYNILYFNTFI